VSETEGEKAQKRDGGVLGKTAVKMLACGFGDSEKFVEKVKARGSDVKAWNEVV